MALVLGLMAVLLVVVVGFRADDASDDAPRREVASLPRTKPSAKPGRTTPTSKSGSSGPSSSREMSSFMSAVEQDVAGYWGGVFDEARLSRPHVAVAWPAPGDSSSFSCSRTGRSDDSTAAYCPADRKIVVSIAMAQRIWDGEVRANHDDTEGRTAGDFSLAYAIAHEYAHAVQHELGIVTGDPRTTRYPVVATELHADCWAGIWANSAYREGVLEPGDVQEGIDAAAMVGDYAFDDVQHHGTPAQRMAAFTTGYRAGVATACDSLLGTNA